MNITKNHAFIASAGTGKTEQLALRFISLLDFSSPDSTLAVTFTRNAAGEILERIIKRLINAYYFNDEKKKLEEELQLSTPLEQEKLKLWISVIIDKLPRLSISTLDSFFYQIIACYPLELGLNSAPDIAQGYVDKKLKNKVIKQLFAQAKNVPEFLTSLKDIIAGLTENKESGKITDRINEVIDIGYKYFLDSRANAWKGLKTNIVIEKLPLWEEMINNLALSYPGENGNFNNYIIKLKNKDYNSVFSSGATKSFLNGKEKYYKLRFDTEAIKELLQNIIDYATVKILEDSNKKTNAYFYLLNIYDQLLENAKISENVINYSDIYKLLINNITPENNQSGLHVYYRLDSRINNFLIDEFQDTNREQWQAVRPLATEAIMDTDEDRTYFMVGDMKQSIYGWRGGDPRLFTAICNRYEIKTDTLVKSYRAGQNILDAINCIFTSPIVKNWADEFKFEKHISAVKEPGYFEYVETGKEEIEGIDSIHFSVKELLNKINPVERGLSISILFRKKNEIDSMADYLKSNGIECFIQGKSPLFQRSVVRRLLALFELMENPENRVAKYHITENNSYLKNIVPKSKLLLHTWLNSLKQKLIYDSYANVIASIIQPLFPELDEKAIIYLEQLIAIAEQYESIKTANPKDFLIFVEETEISTPKSESGIILSTIHGAKGLGYDVVILPDLSFGTKTPSVYYEKNKIDILGDEKEIKTITTLSKKEFENVLPVYKNMRELYLIEQKNELLNLLYVALTRAKKAVYLFDKEIKTEIKEIKNFSNLLGPALIDFEHKNASAGTENISGVAFCAIGSANWFKKYEPSKTKQKSRRKIVRKISLKKSVTRFRPYQTPSSLHIFKNNDRAAVFSSGSNDGRAKGTIIHAFFSRIEWFSDDITKEKLYDNYLNSARKIFPGKEEDFYKKTVDEFFEILRKEQIRNILTKPDEKCEVKNEFSFAAIIDEKLTNGIFDRVVFFPNSSLPEKAEIYDYKTDAVISEEEINECYKKALVKGCSLDKEKITAKLVFTAPGKIIDV